ncbi:hypothetical protein ACQKJG_30940 [Priestia megaterium]|uniref:hypothetical protein n=1 Tax=Priestia megaterium TaxID=1404 RepID=UPI002D8027B3|nr:hypothetical protein [Priestia megaterium]MEB4861353.1 hypothetical protein [Priestia megaterium]
MDTNKDLIKGNLPLYPGLLFFLIFGGQFIIRYVRDDDFYILHFIFGTLGLLMVIASLLIKKRRKANERSI